MFDTEEEAARAYDRKAREEKNNRQVGSNCVHKNCSTYSIWLHLAFTCFSHPTSVAVKKQMGSITFPKPIISREASTH
jgi:hypothetical protein